MHVCGSNLPSRGVSDARVVAHGVGEPLVAQADRSERWDKRPHPGAPERGHGLLGRCWGLRGWTSIAELFNSAMLVCRLAHTELAGRSFAVSEPLACALPRGRAAGGTDAGWGGAPSDAIRWIAVAYACATRTDAVAA